MKTITGIEFLKRKYRQFGSLFKPGRHQRIKTRPGFGETFMNRREIIQSLALAPFIGPSITSLVTRKGWVCFEEKNLKERMRITVHNTRTSMVKDPKLKVPHAKVAGLEISRMILGGNLIGGWAHSRDLVYVSDLVKKYFTDEKVFETFAIAEKFGINTFLTNPILCRVINEYWKQDLGKIKFISDGGFDLSEGIKISIDNGASACYTHGGRTDILAREGKLEEIGKALEMIKSAGIPAGIGGHELSTIKACVDYGLKPDFWMKTLHHNNYWSSNKENQNDNIWCTEPENTAEYMKSIKQPWIAFKTLAAGAIDPKAGMRYAFGNGADFICVCVGMFDWQIEEDVEMVMNVLNSDLKRERPWMA